MAVKNVVINVKANTKGIKQLQTAFDKLEKENKQLATQYKKTNATLQNGMKKSEKSVSGMGNQMKNLGGVIAGAFAVGSIVSFGKSILDTRAEFQKLEAVLTNTLGSKSEAQQSMKNLQKFASETPFSVVELTQSFVKLVNQGFKPTMSEMTKLGDLASSTGKTFDMLAEGIIDAQTGEFERLKEFGIRASKQGDEVKFSFKGVETQTKFTSEAITEYITSLGSLKGVSGSMAAISKTLGGQMSNLGDAWDSLLNSLGTKTEGAFASAIGYMAEFVESLTSTATASDDVVAKLGDEQTAIQDLIIEVSDVNLKSSDRVRIIKELKTEYPALVGFLNTETSSNEDLARALGVVNESLHTRSLIQKQVAKLEHAGKELDDGKIANQEVLNNLLSDGIAMLTEKGKMDLIKGKTDQERLLVIRDEAKGFSNLRSAVSVYLLEREKLNNEEKDYNDLQVKTAKNVTAIIQSVGDLNALRTDELKTLVLNHTLTDKSLDQQARLIIIKREQAEALRLLLIANAQAEKDAVDSIANQTKLVAKLSKAYKEAEYQSVEYYDALNKLTEAQARLKEMLNPTNKALEEQKNRFKELDAELKELDIMKPAELRMMDINDEGQVSNEDLYYGFMYGMTKQEYDEQVESDASRKEAINSALLEGAERVSDALFDAKKRRLDAEFEYEKSILQSKLQAGKISQSSFEVEQKKLFQQQAQREKKLATFEIIVAGAVASAKVWSQWAGVPVVAGILQGIVVAETALQIGAVNSQPLPVYEKGGWIGGERHRHGGTLVEAEKDEFIVNRGDSITNKSLLENINGGNTMAYINKTYVYPALKQQSLDMMRDKSFADNIAKSIQTHQMADGRIVGALGQINNSSKKNTDRLLSAFKTNRNDIRNV